MKLSPEKYVALNIEESTVDRLTKPPFPGSKEAVDAGCKCPRFANFMGAGASGLHYGHANPRSPKEKIKEETSKRYFMIDEKCPVHKKC